LIRFKEKGGKEKEIPVHHKLEEVLDEYLKVSKLSEKSGHAAVPNDAWQESRASVQSNE
jgi:site-specific recombinase XerC